MRYLSILLLVILLISCEAPYHPKPLVYHRIDLPTKTKRVAVDSPCEWESVAPMNSKFKVDPKNECWITWDFPEYNSEVFLTYLPIKNPEDLRTLLDEMHQLSYDHQKKANDIKVDANKLQSGNLILEYNITGNAATPYQFCITDSTNHYMRGSLYFRNTPNYDSIAPVLDYLKQEIHVYLDSLKWKN